MVEWEADHWLLTPDEISQLPMGTELVSIGNDKVIVGVDEIDTDTRWGHTAYGIKHPMQHALAPQFSMMILATNRQNLKFHDD